MFIEPKVTTSTYVSYFFSGYQRWFAEWGYPLLDIVRQESGEWGIIGAHIMPTIPCMTPWTWVITPMKHREINPWICKKLVDNLDVEKRFVWDDLERREEETRKELIREELHVSEFARRKYEAITRNPDLMNRIAKNGIGELSLRNLARHIPNHHYRRDAKKKEVPHAIANAVVRDSPVSPGQDLPAGVGVETSIGS